MCNDTLRPPDVVFTLHHEDEEGDHGGTGSEELVDRSFRQKILLPWVTDALS